MKKLDDKVRRFKQLLLSSKDLGDSANAFYDLTDMPEFLDLGKPARSLVLDAYLPVAGESLFGKVVPVKQMICLRVKKYKMYHGHAQLGPFQATMVYVEDIDRGLLAVWDHIHSVTKFLRITQIAKANPNDPIFVANPQEPATD